MAEPYRRGPARERRERDRAGVPEVVADKTILVQVLNPGPRRDLHTPADLEAVLSGLKKGDVVTFLVYDVGTGWPARAVTVAVGGSNDCSENGGPPERSGTRLCIGRLTKRRVGSLQRQCTPFTRSRFTSAASLHSRPRESGGTGRRTRLRIWRRKAWGFESPLSHRSGRGIGRGNASARQADREQSARRGRRAHVDRSPMRGDDPFGDVETQSQAARWRRRSSLGAQPLEGAEQPGHLDPLDRGTTVLHSQHHVRCLALHRDADRLLSIAVLNRVAEQVGYELTEARSIPLPAQVAGGRELQRAVGMRVRDFLYYLAHDAAKVALHSRDRKT